MNFLIVIIASGIARGRVCMTTTTATESRKVAATCSLGLMCTSLILDIHVMIN